jgi:hypothetical protein
MEENGCAAMFLWRKYIFLLDNRIPGSIKRFCCAVAMVAAAMQVLWMGGMLTAGADSQREQGRKFEWMNLK